MLRQVWERQLHPEQTGSRNQSTDLIQEEIGCLDFYICGDGYQAFSNNDNMMGWQDFIFLWDWKILILLGNKRKLYTA